MSGKFDNILQTIGRTPIVRLNKLAPEGINLFVKIESFNPMGSVKDRLARGIIEDAEESGELQPGQTVIEATSGNTGIGLAMVCAQKGYPLVITMAESFSLERRKMMRFLGARVILTPAELKGTGMLTKATELAGKHGWFLCRQFENEANANAHSRTTAPEILADFEGERLDYWVTGFGTGGTLKGVSRVLAKERPETRIIVCEPDNSQLLGSGIAQKKNADGTPAESHPLFRPHPVQGWGPDFIPKLTEDAVAGDLIDQIVPVSGDDAFRLSKALARQEGIFVGISGGATLAGALKICEDAEPGSTVLCMLPDTGERYLTTPLFDDISEDMSEAELEISVSTPFARFDVPPATTAGEDDTGKESVNAPAYAVDFLRASINDKEKPVTLFALEWCEFCWSVRKMLAKYEIDYQSFDLDSVAYQIENKGGDIRMALHQNTGLKTIPQIYIGGVHVGGASELFDACRDGTMQTMLEENSVSYNKTVSDDPYSFLPGWLHSR